VRRPKGIRKRERLALADLLPSREGMRRQWRGSTKSLNEHLGPLRRYLRSQVDRPWNKVFSEISRHLRLDSAVQKHVLDHLHDYVATHILEIDGQWFSASGRPFHRRFGPLFYVCPRTGLLRENKCRSRRKRVPTMQPRTRLVIDAWRQYQLLNDLWYEVRLEPIVAETFGRWDVVLRRPVDWALLGPAWKAYGRPAFAASKRQLSKREIRRVQAQLDECLRT
jgi:hypothetical protein